MDRDRATDSTDARRWTALPVGGASDAAAPLDGSEWRWRNYTDHLEDLGYELHGASATEEADELAQAVDDYRHRADRTG